MRMIPYKCDQDSLCNASKAYANRSAAASSEIRRKPTSRPADGGWVHRQTRQRRKVFRPVHPSGEGPPDASA